MLIKLGNFKKTQRGVHEATKLDQTFNEINVDGNAQSEERIEIEATSASINENNTEDMSMLGASTEKETVQQINI
ncbi:4904_t:CDS:2 [Ambispora leptoticha]|uniref:4904_t:CDS:1 n=1 Tax=Ambispora leptoticha TaxID=144679 RepID=A0A9N9C544_9GLOM|nr:4904_t:CDS:2 [Ambispora leptoticha]